QGVDRTVNLDVYVSTKRAYLYVNSTPYGCVDLPPGRLSPGTATIAFGDVLYHSAADLGNGGYDWYPFHQAHMQFFQARHYSNLASPTGSPEPSWYKPRLPCVPAASLVPHW